MARKKPANLGGCLENESCGLSPDHIFAIRYTAEVVDKIDTIHFLRFFGDIKQEPCQRDFIRTPFCYARAVEERNGLLIPIEPVEHVYLLNVTGLVYEDFCRPWIKKRRFSSSKYTVEQVPVPDWYTRRISAVSRDQEIVPVHSLKADFARIVLLQPADREKYNPVESFLASDAHVTTSVSPNLWSEVAKKYFERNLPSIPEAQYIRTEDNGDLVQNALFRIMKGKEKLSANISKKLLPHDQIAAFYGALHNSLKWSVDDQLREQVRDPLANTVSLRQTFSTQSDSPEFQADSQSIDDYWDSAMSIAVPNAAERQKRLIQGKDALREIKAGFKKLENGDLLYDILHQNIFEGRTLSEIAKQTKSTTSKVRTLLAKAVEISKNIALDKAMFVPGQFPNVGLSQSALADAHASIHRKVLRKKRAKISQRSKSRDGT